MGEKEEIRKFIDVLQQQYGNLPKFDLGNKFNNKLYYITPYYSEEELTEFVHTFLFGKWAASGSEIFKFEKAYSKIINANYSLMVNSGSSANLVLFAALKKKFGWKDGAEVIISSAGFATSYSAIILNNLKPVFVDIELNTFNFDLDKVEEAITENTVAVFNSPMLGNPCNIDKLKDICDFYNLLLIMDGCDSLGSLWKDKHLSEYAYASTDSFYMAHIISTSQGGMISTNDEELYELCRSLIRWGSICRCSSVGNTLPNGVCGNRFCDWLQNGTITDHKYVYGNIGYNLQPAMDAQGSLGLIQLRKLSEIKRKRKQSKDVASDIFESWLDVFIPKELEDADTCWFATPIMYKEKDKLVNFLESRGIQTRPYFCGNVLTQPAYRSFGNWRDYPNTNLLAEQVFFIGANPNWTNEHFVYLETVIKEFVNG